jgi:hypothetical protein
MLSIATYDDTSAITQNPDTASVPFAYNKVVFTGVDSSGFYACYVSMNEATLVDAELNAGLSDPNDLATGCLGAPWTRFDVQ